MNNLDEMEEMTNVLLENRYDLHENQKNKLKILAIILLVIVGVIETGIYLFFKTDLFQEYKELWVQTAMTTMNHQYLATWFLSENEINAIMAKLEVQNNENSDINAINIENIEEEKKENKITVEKITGKTYVRLCYANYGLYKSYYDAELRL